MIRDVIICCGVCVRADHVKGTIHANNHFLSEHFDRSVVKYRLVASPGSPQ